MEKRIIFRKPFRILTEKDEGYEIDAICFFQSYPWVYNARTLDDKEAKEKGYRIENVVTQYKRRFYLDLWFVRIHIQWLSKDKYVNSL